MTTTAKTITTLAAALLLAVSALAQTPPMENQMAGLLDWRVVYNLTMVPHQSVALPVITTNMILSFNNPNNQVVDATIQSSPASNGPWKTETNFLANPGQNEWRDYDINQPAKFYRVNFGWWF